MHWASTATTINYLPLAMSLIFQWKECCYQILFSSGLAFRFLQFEELLNLECAYVNVQFMFSVDFVIGGMEFVVEEE